MNESPLVERLDEPLQHWIERGMKKNISKCKVVHSCAHLNSHNIETSIYLNSVFHIKYFSELIHNYVDVI